MKTAALALILASALIATPSFADLAPDRFHGQVLVQSNGAQRIFVLVDSFEKARGRDGRVDHIFVLASSSDFASGVSKLFEEAEVVVYPHAVLIQSPSERSAFVLSTHDVDVQAAQGLTLTRYQADAMSHHWGSTELRIESSKRSTIEAFDGCEACYPEEIDPWGGTGTGAQDCQAGGSNSNSCSINCGSFTGSSCSVSCTRGYSCCWCRGGSAYCKCQT